MKVSVGIGVGAIAFGLVMLLLAAGIPETSILSPANERSSTPLLLPTVGSPPARAPDPSPGPISSKKTPETIKAIYLTSWSAATPSRVNQAIELIKNTELNGIVIDVKDYTGKVVFATSSPLIKQIGSEEHRLGDLAELVERLHQEGIYVIARMVVFQDQHLIKVRPDLAVRDSAGRVWRDRKGLGWVDPASREVWEYNVEIAREAAGAGVDELNFDYIRFPSDGTISELRYPIFDERKETKREVIRRFFEFLATELRPTGKQLSADVFGLVTIKGDDLGIGQVLEDAFLYFDFVSPMVYPSHYARGFLQFKNPAAHPYEVVRYSLERALWRRARLAEMIGGLTIDSFSQEPLHPSEHLARVRPWLQAFDLGAPYPPEVIRTQMRAVYDTGLQYGWYLWSPSNKYQPASFERGKALPDHRSGISPR